MKSEESAALVKHQVSHVVKCVKARSFWCRTMLAHKIEVVRRKSHNLAQAVTSAIQVAWNDAALKEKRRCVEKLSILGSSS